MQSLNDFSAGLLEKKTFLLYPTQMVRSAGLKGDASREAERIIEWARHDLYRDGQASFSLPRGQHKRGKTQ